ncbi:hypothetical protein D3C86_2051370 [compost metagenome]
MEPGMFRFSMKQAPTDQKVGFRDKRFQTDEPVDQELPAPRLADERVGRRPFQNRIGKCIVAQHRFRFGSTLLHGMVV